MSFLKKSFAITLLSASMIGCNLFVDDQKNLSNDLYNLANPKPEMRKFVENNRSHKVLVAIIDSGVDYNHPDLNSAMHFDLTEDGSPTGLGWDYLGNDEWASPYLVRIPSSDPQDLMNRLNMHNQQVIENAMLIEQNLSKKINEHRLIESEINSRAYHGTHVAGLLIDETENSIGILPYRVFPIARPDANLKATLNADELLGSYLDMIFDNLIDAHQRAYDKGARIINLSMVYQYKEEFLKKPTLMVKLESHTKRYIEFLNNHPDLLIVAASGNNYGLDLVREDVFQLPCGLNHPQIVCVGSVNSKKEPSSFSNKFTGYEYFLSEEGENVFSAYPTKFCDVSLVQSPQIAFLSTLISTSLLNDFSMNPIDIVKSCKRAKSRHILSGTSMATPKIAKKAALIKVRNPNMSVHEIVQTLLRL